MSEINEPEELMSWSDCILGILWIMAIIAIALFPITFYLLLDGWI